MVICESHATPGEMRAEGIEALPVLAPGCVVAKARPLVERHRQPLDRVGDFAVDHDRGAVARKKLEVRRHGFDLLGHRAPREAPRIPARDAGDAELAELRRERRGLARELVAELEALEA